MQFLLNPLEESLYAPDTTLNAVAHEISKRTQHLEAGSLEDNEDDTTQRKEPRVARPLRRDTQVTES